MSDEGAGRRPEKPTVTGTTHVLPFSSLDPATFERLCLWLVRAEGFRNVEHYGAAGSDSGRDLVGYSSSRHDDELWYFQCKRRSKVSIAALIDDSERAQRAILVGGLRPVGMIFLIAGTVTARTRDAVRGHLADRGLQCHFWGATELDARTKSHPAVLAEFFRMPPTPSPDRGHAPRRLPRAPMRFINRERELAALDTVATESALAPGPVVAVLSGMHGVGKTAAASHWTNRHRMSFDGGDLYGDFSRRRHGVPVDPSEVLADFLRDLGTSDAVIPSTFSARRRLFESLTADRRLLMLLDDVEEPAQVFSLLPTGSGSVVLVTSSRRLEELFYEGATHVALEPLDTDASRYYLATMIGVERVGYEPEGINELVELCAGLPIVLSVAGGRLASDRNRSVSWLLQQIQAAPHKLAALSSSGDYAADAVFDFAYADLDPRTALTYRRLGLHPGPDTTVPVVSALTGDSIENVERSLARIFEAYLVDSPTAGRYRPHDLIRDHSRACLETDDDAKSIDEAARRLVDWYLAALRLADRAIVADRIRLSDGLVLDAQNLPTFGSSADAFSWFAVERMNVLAVIAMASDLEWDDRVWQIAETLWPLCASHKLFSEWITSHSLAVASGRRLDDACVVARFCSQLARAYAEQGATDQAAASMADAVTAADLCGDDLLRASVTEFGGVCLLHAGEPRKALAEFDAARRTFAHHEQFRGAALQDLYRGTAFVRLGENALALDAFGTALDSLTMSHDEISVARVLLQRGRALTALENLNEARSDLEQAVLIMSKLGILLEQAEAFETLVEVERLAQRPDVARGHRRRAYELYVELGHARAQSLSVDPEGERT